MGILTPEIIMVPLLAGILSNFILNRLALFATIYFFRRGHDPNNIMGPFVTTAGDVISTISLLVVILLVI